MALNITMSNSNVQSDLLHIVGGVPGNQWDWAFDINKTQEELSQEFLEFRQ